MDTHAPIEHGSPVRIHIDQQPYESPNPTTGVALYALGRVGPGLGLFREIRGNREDTPVEEGGDTFLLREDEHFHSGPRKAYRIFVNGQEKLITTKTVTFEQLVALSFPTPPVGQGIIFTVSYEDGPHPNPSGSLTAGGKVKVQDGMVFNVTPTDRS